MEKSIELRLQRLVPIMIDYLKKGKPPSGIIDISKLGAQVINHLVNRGDILTSDRAESKYYLCHLIRLSFKMNVPDLVMTFVCESMMSEYGISREAEQIAAKI